ncbi:MAG TPA: hypothetical protein DCE02_01795 [Ruminiclostridium sp.]|jgi:hypothetical protein|uniref:Uncharacterized protein n=1 Tax=Acetivibrio saccincola TaxID=1677857 RepID=A0A2K9E5T1_9FIRM|nr:hypothetical protein [Acetivibrio saccincola]AUG59082.1 hypothetical protein HVS_16215 [Acetivibrio saccincola]NLW26187.1 hypothetical protein [Acetivibrio saccincola]PQQ65853.1 hypothetical protein B9R14_03105 [Acetivibrio saccincola]HAA42726.1 hypothetical protein [Ruminiclostridium sp.]
MLKRLIGLFVFAMLLLGCCISTYANDTANVPAVNIINDGTNQEELSLDDALFRNKDTEDTEQFLVTITRPEGDESTFRKSYIVCGNSTAEGITVKLYMYSEESGTFEPFKNTEGESSWNIGISGFFIKEIELPNVGANRIRIAAYKNGGELVLGENAQVNTFTVTLLDSEVKNSLKRGFFNINQMLMKIFGT